MPRFKAAKLHHWKRSLLPYLVKHCTGFEGGLCLGCGLSAFCPDPGWLAVSGDPLHFSLALQSRAAGTYHWLLWEVDESGMTPRGPWVARGETALMCQSLSPEVPEPQGVRHFLARQSLGAVSSSCCISLSVLHACLRTGPGCASVSCQAHSRRTGVCTPA